METREYNIAIERLFLTRMKDGDNDYLSMLLCYKAQSLTPKTVI